MDIQKVIFARTNYEISNLFLSILGYDILSNGKLFQIFRRSWQLPSQCLTNPFNTKLFWNVSN